MTGTRSYEELEPGSEVAPVVHLPGTSRGRWLSGVGWLVSGNLLSIGLTTGVGLALARALGPQDFGYYSLAVVVTSFGVTLVTFRLEMDLVAVLPTLKDQTTTLYRSIRASYLLGVPLCLLAGTLTLWMLDGRLRIVAFFAIVEILAWPLLLTRALLQVRMQQRTLAAAGVANRAIWLLLIGFLFVLIPGNTLVWAVAFRWVPTVIEAHVVAHAARVRLWGWLSLRGLNEEVATLKRTAPLMAGGLAGTFNNRIDQPLIAALRSVTENGLYAAAVRVVEPVRMLPAIVQNVSQPELVESFAARDERRFIAAVRDSLFLMFVPSAFLITLLFSAGPSVTATLFGPAFASSGDVVRILALAEISILFASTFQSAALAAGERGTLARSSVVGVAVNLALLLFLVPGLGVEGAAWSSLVGYSVTAGWLLVPTALRKLVLPALRGAWRLAIPPVVAIGVVELLGLAPLPRLVLAGLVYIAVAGLLMTKEFVRLGRFARSRIGTSPSPSSRD